MRILVAPDSFKGSFSAKEVADSIESGIIKARPSFLVYKLPLADGGEGTVDAFTYARKGRKLFKEVVGPLGEIVTAHFGIIDDENTAVLEMAAASGLEHVPPQRANPLKTTTYGTGQLIKAALDENVTKIIIGLGGSATVDAGMGMAQALGARFKDDLGQDLGYGGAELGRLREIDLTGFDPRLKDVEFIIASDVNNPIFGLNGAAYVFGPQKGASPIQVERLDGYLRNFANVVKRDLGVDLNGLPGGGAAGGLGAAAFVFLNAKMQSGIDTILDGNGFDSYLDMVDLVITGEGMIDRQTLMGKAPFGVAKRAKARNIPVLAIAGSVEYKAVPELNRYFDAIFSITQMPLNFENVKEYTDEWIRLTISQIIRCIDLL